MNGVSTYSLYKFSQKFLLSRVSFFPHLTTISKIIEHITTCKNLNGKVIFSYSHSIIEIVFYDYTSNLYYRTSKTRMFVIHWTSDFTENRCYAAFRCYTVSQWVFVFIFPVSLILGEVLKGAKSRAKEYIVDSLGYRCPWVAVVAYYQETRLLVFLPYAMQ